MSMMQEGEGGRKVRDAAAVIASYFSPRHILVSSRYLELALTLTMMSVPLSGCPAVSRFEWMMFLVVTLNCIAMAFDNPREDPYGRLETTLFWW